jgi:hypothetical protein
MNLKQIVGSILLIVCLIAIETVLILCQKKITTKRELTIQGLKKSVDSLNRDLVILSKERDSLLKNQRHSPVIDSAINRTAFSRRLFLRY